METEVDAFEAVYIERHGVLVGHHLLEIVIRVAEVGHRPCDEHPPVHILHQSAVAVDIAGHDMLALGHGQHVEAFLHALEHRHGTVRLDIAMNLSTHLIAEELLYLRDLYLISK